jgi:hypothetical protein
MFVQLSLSLSLFTHVTPFFLSPLSCPLSISVSFFGLIFSLPIYLFFSLSLSLTLIIYIFIFFAISKDAKHQLQPSLSHAHRSTTWILLLLLLRTGSASLFPTITTNTPHPSPSSQRWKKMQLLLVQLTCPCSLPSRSLRTSSVAPPPQLELTMLVVADSSLFGHTLMESAYGGNTRACGASIIEYVRVSLCFDIAPINSTFLCLDIENVSILLSDHDRMRTIGNCDGDGELEFEGDSVLGSLVGEVVGAEVRR